MTDANLVNIIAVSIIVGVILLVVAFMWKLGTFPRKKKLTFRIIEKKEPNYSFYKVQLKRGLFGWMGFCVSTRSNSIWASSLWSRDFNDRKAEILEYLDLCGRKLSDSDVTFINKTTKDEDNS